MPLPQEQSVQLTPAAGNVNFGSVPASSSSAPFVVHMLSTGSGTANFYITPADSRYTATPSGNISLASGSSIDVTFQFNASATLGSSSCLYFGFQGQGLVNPGPLLSAITVAGGAPVWNVNPSYIDFGSLKIGTSSAPVPVTISNTGSTSLVINNIALTPTDFTLSGLPTFPATVLAGHTLVFDVTCNSTYRGVNDYNPGITITPSIGASQTVELVYQGFILTPAFVLSGATQGVLFGLSGSWGSALNTYIAQSLSEFPPEAAASFSKMHDFGNPSTFTYANRVYFRTECFGAVTATLQSTAVISGEVNTASDTKTRSSATDSTGIPTDMVFDIETNGEIHNLVLTLEAAAGILSITQYTPCYEKRGNVYEAS